MVGMPSEGTVGGLWLGVGGVIYLLKVTYPLLHRCGQKTKYCRIMEKFLVLPKTNNRKITSITNKNNTINKQTTTRTEEHKTTSQPWHD